MGTIHKAPVQTAAYEVTVRFNLDYVNDSDRSGCHNDSSEFTDTVVVNARVYDDHEDSLAEAEYEAIDQIKRDRDIEKDSPYRSSTPGYAVHYAHEVLSIKKLAS